MKHANISLFVPHIGCPNQCSFCNQRSISGAVATALTPADVAGACQRFLEEGRQQRFDAELAFFGGSFTAIDRVYMVSLLKAAQPFLGEGKLKGIRLSTRPDAIDSAVLALLKHYGVTAIELGAQSMCDAVLTKNQRGHTMQDVQNAAKMIRAQGFELGLQMMVGLYGDNLQTCRTTAKALAALEPDTMRIYPTVVLKDTPLAELYHTGEYCPLTLEQGVEQSAELLWFFWQKGIKVIRLGLHDGEALEQSMLAGVHHPALRELCEGEIYFKNVQKQLITKNINCAILYVAPFALSRMIGQKRCNMQRLQQRGFTVKVLPKEGLKLFEVEIAAINQDDSCTPKQSCTSNGLRYAQKDGAICS